MLAYKITTAPVIGSNHGIVFGERLKIEFDGRPIEKLSVAEVWIWNAGNETLGGKELLPGDPLRVQIAKTYGILDTKIALNPNPGAEIELIMSSNNVSCEIKFRHLKAGNGVLLTVLHTAPSGSIDIRGDLLSTKIEDDFGGRESTRKFERRKKVCLSLTVVGVFCVILYALLRRLIGQEIILLPWFPKELENFESFGFYLVMIPLFWWTFFPGGWRHRIPEALQTLRHNEEEVREMAVSDKL